MSAFVVRLLRRIPKQPQTVLVTCCYAVAAAVAAVAFQVLISALYRFGIARFAQHSTRAFLLESFAVVVVTSAIVGWLLNTFCPEAAGSGIPQLKLAFWKEFGFVSWRTVWVKFAAGALSIGGGSSLGREG